MWSGDPNQTFGYEVDSTNFMSIELCLFWDQIS